MVRLCSLFYGFTLVASNAIVTEPAKGAPPIVPDGVKTKHIIHEGTRSWKLACTVDGDRPLLITWTKDGESITSAWPRFKQSNEAKYLQIRNVAMEDSGRYRCRAANGFGSVEVEYVVTVVAKNQLITSTTTQIDEDAEDDFSPPDLTDLPFSSLSDGVSRAPFWIDTDPSAGSSPFSTNYQRPVGGHIKLRCHAAGLPKPDIIWLKDGREMDGDGASSLGGWSRGKWALHLKDLRLSDSGSYTCKIFNIWGSLNATYAVKVISEDPALPQFEHMHPLNTTVQEGHSATFQCRVRSQEKPVLQWIKVIEDPSHLDFNQSVTVQGLHITVLDRKYASDMVDFRNSTYSKLLYIPRAQVGDAGWYVCVVTSQKGHLSHRFAYLNVISAWSDHHIPVTDQPLPLHIVVGIPVAFVVLLLVGYAIYFLQKHQQKPTPSPTSPTATTVQGPTSTASTAPSSSSNGHRNGPPPPPTYPPPSLPHKASPPRTATPPHQYTASSSDHSSATHQQQPLLKENGYMPQPQQGLVYKPKYKAYHPLDPHMIQPLNGQLSAMPETGLSTQIRCNGDLGYEGSTAPATPQPYELRYDDSELSDCYEPRANGAIQHYPSLYSCR